MNDFINYVITYDSTFNARISGASPEEIADLERLVDHPLPEKYKQFLALMGHSDDELALAYQGSTDITAVREYYAGLIEGEETPPPSNCIVIGTGDISVGQICLELGHSEEPRVVFAMDKIITGLYAETLEKLLFRRAFSKFRLRLLPESGIYTSAGPQLLFKASEKVARQLNFTPQWFSDEAVFCGENINAGVFIEQYQRKGIWIRIAAESRVEVERTGRFFMNEVGVSFYQWLA
ncbi:MAG: SMI1/KNR4 family protein [Acidobacteriota bacterium]|nr:SMI1/KNR4 family protein [Acidobacteriota bacterium]